MLERKNETASSCCSNMQMIMINFASNNDIGSTSGSNGAISSKTPATRRPRNLSDATASTVFSYGSEQEDTENVEECSLFDHADFMTNPEDCDSISILSEEEQVVGQSSSTLTELFNIIAQLEERREMMLSAAAAANTTITSLHCSTAPRSREQRKNKSEDCFLDDSLRVTRAHRRRARKSQW
jgi:hypothetical protein